MNDTSNAGNAKSAGRRLRPYEIATMLIPLQGGAPVRVIDATDEQFQAFINGAGVPIDEQGIAEWSFDDRVGIVNHALKHGMKLPFVEEEDTGVYAPSGPLSKASQDAFSERVWEQNNSDTEQKPYPPQADMTARHFQNAVSVLELEKQMRDEHPFPSSVPTSTVRDYPDLEGE